MPIGIGPIGGFRGAPGSSPVLPFIFDRAASVQNTATTLIASWRNDTGYDLVLSHVSVVSDPGAAQNITAAQLYISPDSSVLFPVIRWLKRDDVAKAANLDSSLDWDGWVIVPQGWFVEGRTLFNAGGASNGVFLTLLAYALQLRQLAF